MDKEEVARILGQPAEKRTLVRTETPGFGFPSWWESEVGLGESVEQWVYTTPEGTDEIYFLKNSARATHTRFIRKGVVF